MITRNEQAAADLRGKSRAAGMNLSRGQWMEIKSLRGLPVVHFLEFYFEFRVERHQQRPVAAISNAMAAALFDLGREARVKTTAGNAQCRKRCGLDHLAQRREHARRGGTCLRPGFNPVENRHPQSGLRQTPGNRATDDSATDDQYISSV